MKSPVPERTEIEQFARIGRSDVRRALDLINEASPKLADMVKAKVEPKANVDDCNVSDLADRLKIKTIKSRATYTGIFKSGDDNRPCLSYCVHARRPDGQVRLINGSVHITDPTDFARLQSEFEIGDKIEIALEANRSSPNIPVRLISFERVSAAAEEKAKYDSSFML